MFGVTEENNFRIPRPRLNLTRCLFRNFNHINTYLSTNANLFIKTILKFLLPHTYIASSIPYITWGSCELMNVATYIPITPELDNTRYTRRFQPLRSQEAGDALTRWYFDLYALFRTVPIFLGEIEQYVKDVEGWGHWQVNQIECIIPNLCTFRIRNP